MGVVSGMSPCYRSHGVPPSSVWEKMMERMKEVGASITGFKRTLADWAKRKGLEGNQNKQRGESVPWGWTVANMLVHKKVHTALGLNRAELSIVGSAPVSPDVLDYFMSVNIPILEVYGMSENTGPHTINRPDAGYWRSGSVGRPVEGMEVKIGSPDENGEGEVSTIHLCMPLKGEAYSVGLAVRYLVYPLSLITDPDARTGCLHGLPGNGGQDS